jgi:hypothetical protein
VLTISSKQQTPVNNYQPETLLTKISSDLYSERQPPVYNNLLFGVPRVVLVHRSAFILKGFIYKVKIEARHDSLLFYTLNE